MVQINPYLIFNGTCEAAFLFYQSVFNSSITYLGRFGEMPIIEGQDSLPESDKNRVMHVTLPIGNTVLMGSDSNTQSGAIVMGENVSISINLESRDEVEKIFNGLSQGGTIKMPLTDTFWGAYFGMFIDQFGIHWMVNFDSNQQ